MKAVHKLPVALLIFALSASSPVTCPELFSQTSASAAQTEAQPLAAAPIAQAIPFLLYHNRVYLQLKVNDSQPLWFVLDSGAGVTAIDIERARQLGLKMSGQVEVENLGAGEGKTTIAAVKDVSFSLRNVTWSGKDVYTIPLDGIEPFEGHPLDGALGFDFFNRYVVEVDYPNRVLNLYEPRAYAYKGRGAIIPFKIEGNWISVPTTIVPLNHAPIETSIQIDSGARGTVELRRPFIEKHKLLTTLAKTFPGIRYGVGGEAPQLMSRIQSLQLGPFVIQNPVTGFSQAQKGAGASTIAAGTINGNILRRFKVIFDYARKRVILEPGADADAAYEYDMSGAVLHVARPDFKIVKVYRVFANSPAAEAGLREGDIITAINDQPTASMTLEEIEQLFQQEGRECLLSVRRGEETRQLKIKLRRLV